MTVEKVTTGTLIPANMDERIRYAAELAQGSLLPAAYRGRPANVLIAIELGDALGLRPAVALQTIHVIDGKPSQSADLMATLVRRAGHRLRVQVNEAEKVARATLVRADDPEFEFEAVWTLEKARTAKLLNKDNWQKSPTAMLRARAISEVCRAGASECLLGVEYTPDELDDLGPAEPPSPVGEQATVTVTQARDWRAEVDARRGNYPALKELHGEAFRSGAFQADPELAGYFQAAKEAPAASGDAPDEATLEGAGEAIDPETGEVVDAELVDPEP